MKRSMLMPILGVLLLAGCGETFNDGPPDKQQTEEMTDHHVSLNSIRTLAGMSGETRGDGDEARKLVCIKDAANDTLLYMCDNEGGGWTIYSSDTRVPPIVAQSESGTIADLQKLEPAMAWIQTMAEDMRAIKIAMDSELNFSSQEIERNKFFWKTMSNPDESVKSIMKKPDSLSLIHPNPNPDLINWEDYGHYEYSYTRKYESEYDYIDHLIPVHWHQDYPCNVYCPYKSGSKDEEDRSPAGCSPVADAQMLYFLHNLYGVPGLAPSKAYCYSKNTDKNYNWKQYDFTSDAWDSMNKQCVDETTGIMYWGCAPFIAYIGNLSKTKYGDKGSATEFPTCLTRVYNTLGISYKIKDYDIDIVKESLLSGMPVRMMAESYKDEATNTDDAVHAFIIDRYRRVVVRYESVYVWVYDTLPKNPDGSDVIMPLLPEDVRISYSSPMISMIGMNWGKGSWRDQSWFTLTGDWITGNYNYNKNRKMVYDFKVK